MRVIIPPKRQGDTVTIPFNFTSLLASGETLSSVSYSISVYTGVDANPGALFSSLLLSSSSSTASLQVLGGVIGVIYELKVAAVTTLANTLTLAGFLAVTPDLP